MKKGVTAAISIVVVLIIVVAALFASGIISLNSNTVTKGVTGANNVVSASDVGNSLGGTWTANAGTSGEITSSTGLQQVVNISTGASIANAGSSNAVSKNILIGSLAANGYPAVEQASQYGNYSGGIVGFELGIFSPASSQFSFATVGFLQYNNAATPTSAFANIYGNFSNYSAYNISGSFYLSEKGTSDLNHQYVFASVYAPSSSTGTYNYTTNTFNYNYNYSKSVNESVLIGSDGNFLIFIIGFTQANLTVSSYLTLFDDQVKVAASMSTSLVSTFVSTSTLSTETATTWSQDIAAGIYLNNPSKIINEYLDAQVGAANISSGDNLLINETLGNLTNVGVSMYSSPATGTPTNIGVVGYFQFSSANSVNVIATLIEASAGSEPGLHFANLSGNLGINFSASYLNSTTGVTTYENGYVLLEGHFIVFDFFFGTTNFNLVQLKAVASSEISVA